MDHEEYLKRVKSYIKTPTKDLEQQLEEFCGFCTYVSGQYDQDESFVNLEKHLQELEKDRPETHRIFYMALPPSVFIPVSQHLKRNNYPKKGIARVIVSSLVSTRIQGNLLTSLRLRSRSAKTLLVLVSSSGHLPLTGSRMRSSASTTTWARRWSRTSSSCDLETSSSAPLGIGTTSTTFRYLLPQSRLNSHNSCQISFKEPFGTEGRGGYFDEFGIIRDVMQNRQSFRTHG